MIRDQQHFNLARNCLAKRRALNLSPFNRSLHLPHLRRRRKPMLRWRLQQQRRARLERRLASR